MPPGESPTLVKAQKGPRHILEDRPRSFFFQFQICFRKKVSRKEDGQRIYVFRTNWAVLVSLLHINILYSFHSP